MNYGKVVALVNDDGVLVKKVIQVSKDEAVLNNHFKDGCFNFTQDVDVNDVRLFCVGFDKRSINNNKVWFFTNKIDAEKFSSLANLYIYTYKRKINPQNQHLFDKLEEKWRKYSLDSEEFSEKNFSYNSCGEVFKMRLTDGSLKLLSVTMLI